MCSFHCETRVKALRPISIVMAWGLATWMPSAASAQPRTASPVEPIITAGPRAWVLATTALLSYRNRDRLDMLPPNVRSDSSTAQSRAILHEWWGVDRRLDLLQTLDRLDAGGHRVVFQERGRAFVAMTDRQFEAALAGARKQPHAIRRMKLVREYYAKHRADSFVGWDYCRYIMLCRWGYQVGFLTQDEAWGRMVPAARKIQQAFHSWADLSQDYLVGRELWSPEETEKTGALYREIEAWLLKAPRSEWNRLPWSMELGGPGGR